MSDQASQEPTMEEILASIRRIISEDEPQAEAPEAQAAAPEPEPAPAPVAAAPEPAPVAFQEPVEDDVLDLTEPVAPASDFSSTPFEAETIGDLDVYAPPEPQVRPEPVYQPAPQPVFQAAPARHSLDDEALVTGSAADAAVNAFSQLAQRIAMPSPGATLDDVVRELLRPLLKDWLDRNLPGIVQAKVEEEVERLARRRMS